MGGSDETGCVDGDVYGDGENQAACSSSRLLEWKMWMPSPTPEAKSSWPPIPYSLSRNHIAIT